jgi:hypothetical protein
MFRAGKPLAAEQGGGTNMAHDPHAHHDEPVHHEVRDSTGLTGYAVVKYGFILVITIVVLYFVARYLIPLISD